MRVPLLILHEKVSAKWLETCHEKVIKQLQLTNSLITTVNNYSTEVLVNKEFILDSYSNITSKHARLIEIILVNYNVCGIWREIIIPNSVEPITGIEIIGSKLGVKLAHNMIHFLLNGFDRYYYIHVKDLRYKRERRRSKGIKLPAEVDARKRTNQNIKVKTIKLVDIIRNTIDSRNMIEKKLIIYNHDFLIRAIIATQKLDKRNYNKVSSTIGPKLVTSRKGIIQLNRII